MGGKMTADTIGGFMAASARDSRPASASASEKTDGSQANQTERRWFRHGSRATAGGKGRGCGFGDAGAAGGAAAAGQCLAEVGGEVAQVRHVDVPVVVEVAVDPELA